MRRDQIKKVFLLSGIGSFILFSALLLLLSVANVPGHKEVKTALARQLTKVVPLPARSENLHTQADTVIYVLGGSQKSLKSKLETAAELYHQGPGKRILLLSRPGITSYDPDLRRNLTNDEWDVKVLVALGVKKENIESLPLHEGVLGTFSEAAGIADIAGQRGYRQVILVTAPYHTRRTWVTFSKLLKNRGITLYLYASDEHARLKNLLFEYFKLLLYENVVLPFSTK